MRLTDDRYSKEQRRLEIALRMIRFEARSCTIRECTGFSEDRVRKLFNAYVKPRARGSIRRKRGKSPQQIACFTETAAAQLSASVLAGVLADYKLITLRGPSSGKDRASTELGAQICDAYDFYRALELPRPMSFEHAWFLLRSLRNGELTLISCHDCGGLAIHDTCAPRTSRCVLCRIPTGRIRRIIGERPPRSSG